MLALILSEDDSFFKSAAHRTRLDKYQVIRYRDPVKLVDNLGELKPDLVIVRQRDFPLHASLIAAALAFGRQTVSSKVLIVSQSGIPDHALLPNTSSIPEDSLRRENADATLGFAMPGSRKSPGAGANTATRSECDTTPSRLVAAAERSRRKKP